MGTMRDDLNEALDLEVEADETQDFEETQQEIDSFEEPETETLDTEAVQEPAAAPEVEAAPDVAEEGTPTAEAEPEDKRSIKAPINWAPKEREDWSRIPRHLQEKIMSREKDIQMNLQNTSEARKTAEQFNSVADRYGAALGGVVGGSPMEAVENLFSTAASLRTGSQQEKAQTIANMISQFGIDITALDNAIVGSPQQGVNDPNGEMQRMIDQRLAPIVGQYEQQAQMAQQQEQQAATNQVIAFSEKAEFLNDVREDMADMIDMSAKRGIEMGLEDAYKKACMMNPQIMGVMQQRQKQRQLTGNNSSMAAKKAAATSITGHRGGTGGGGKPQSMRDQIASAWDSSNRD
tara:strand:+ start:20310 stop:21356 length:1047 start_codon:yes stop_codon:yes gene_type:complete